MQLIEFSLALLHLHPLEFKKPICEYDCKCKSESQSQKENAAISESSNDDIPLTSVLI